MNVAGTPITAGKAIMIIMTDIRCCHTELPFCFNRWYKRPKLKESRPTAIMKITPVLARMFTW